MTTALDAGLPASPLEVRPDCGAKRSKSKKPKKPTKPKKPRYLWGLYRRTPHLEIECPRCHRMLAPGVKGVAICKARDPIACIYCSDLLGDERRQRRSVRSRREDRWFKPEVEGHPEFQLPESMKFHDFIISLDTEYTVAAGLSVNVLLSIQAIVIDTRRGRCAQRVWHYNDGVDGVKDLVTHPHALDLQNDRPTLSDVLRACIDLIGRSSTSSQDPMPLDSTILIVSHNAIAELSMLEDRETYLSRGVERNERGHEDEHIEGAPVKRISGGFITLQDLVYPNVDMREPRALHPVYITIRDTMALAPPDMKALASLSATNERWKKVDLEGELTKSGALERLKGEGVVRPIESMHRVRFHDREVFERYAMQDALATLEYFLRFHRSNETSGEAVGVEGSRWFSSDRVGLDTRSHALFIAEIDRQLVNASRERGEKHEPDDEWTDIEDTEDPEDSGECEAREG
jgi:hypothetical protein